MRKNRLEENTNKATAREKKDAVKRAVCAATAALMLVPIAASFTGCAKRSELLRIYNWGDYIDEDALIYEFEDWYRRETGKNVVVDYETFDTNEDMIMRIEVQKTDYDLVCPSDYMAERMIASGLAQKIDKEIFDNSADGLFYDGLAEMVRPFDENNEYFVPYIWGTFGIMYNTERIAPFSEEMMSWEAMWSSAHNKKILMKDSVRDAYSLARIYQNRERLSELSDGFTDYNDEYRAELISYFSEITDATIAAAQNSLLEQKSVLAKYEVDDGKRLIINGDTAELGFFWSCDAGWAMGENGGDKLFYQVPKEGSNVWVDGWIIPKYAKNVEAANYFLKFINTHEYARINYDFLGTSIAVKSVMDEAKAEIEEDDEFGGAYDGFKEMYLEMMFPSEETLARCGVMRDFGSAMSTKLDGMWIDVKTA